MSEEWINYLLNWGPMLMFVLIWGVFMFRQQSKKSAHGKFLQQCGEYYDAHIAELKVQNGKLDKLISILEKK